jgi:Protein of unknown function (DUF541)
MKNLLLFSLLYFAFSGNAQNKQRTIEVMGIGAKNYVADVIYLRCDINAGDRCEIPEGKNYEKMIKNCQAENKKILASRDAIFNGIVASFGDRIKGGNLTNSENKHGVPQNGYIEPQTLTFVSYADVLDFQKKLSDYKDAFSTNVESAFSSKMNEEERQNIQVLALQEAKKKANKLAQALDAQVSEVLNIVETKSVGGDSYLEMLLTMESRKRRDVFDPFMPSSINDKGEITYSTKMYVTFGLK